MPRKGDAARVGLLPVPSLPGPGDWTLAPLVCLTPAELDEAVAGGRTARGGLAARLSGDDWTGDPARAPVI